MEILFVLVPLAVAGVFGYALVQLARGVAEWADNNGKPVLSVPARVVTKRTQTSGGGGNGHHVSTAYYATFETGSGDRAEFKLGGKDYGMIADGDVGTLTYQGTRYHRFERDRGGRRAAAEHIRT